MTTQKQFFALTFASLFAAATAFTGNAQTIKLQGDMVHSNIGFSVPLAGGLTRVTGKFNNWDITINYVDNDMTKSTITAAIKAASISTGDGGRDGHLATADFFDAEKYPDITFASDSIRPTPDGGYIAFGPFSCHGVTKPIQLAFKLVGKDADGNPGFTARYTLLRSDYGLGKNAETDNYISNAVAIEIDFLAKKPKTPAK
jgi:polyisoprenoid-binding protein YceI